MPSSVLSASAKGATFLILLQIGSRALTFGVNQFILRYLSPEILGAAVQLELFSITVIYFARESLRVALQRQQDGVQAVVNLAYLAVLLGAPLAFVLAFVYLRSDLPNVTNFPDAVKIYTVATVIELLSEPGFAAASQKMLYKVRASAEGFAALARTFVTCGSVVWAHRSGTDVGVMPFANGQFAFAMGLLASYLYLLQPTGLKEGFSLLPKKMQNNRENQYILHYFSRPLCNLTFSLLLQSGLKYLLTQGDSILLTTLVSLSDQGAYALASNYGGLIARVILQPIEESSRTLFARLCASPPPSTTTTTTTTDSSSTPSTNNTTSNPTTHPPSPPKSITQAHHTLTLLLRAYTLLSLPLIIHAPPLIELLLPSLLGPRWSHTSAPSAVLAFYASTYIPFLAVNGVLEAFVAAVATPADLARQSKGMALAFAAFALAAWAQLGTAWGGTEEMRRGGKGIVLANVANMLARIVWAMGFLRGWFGARGLGWGWRMVGPRWDSVGLSMGVWVVARWTRGWDGGFGLLGEVSRIGMIGVVHVGLLLFLEGQFAMDCYRMLKPVEQDANDKKQEEKKTT
ncbi:MAG: Oligosaccharide translocation protein rft1 [Bathelium mastoideum]|nr:MAG: Oligosaccharide translocation protein rft1 [Bathelium mastoideum]